MNKKQVLATAFVAVLLFSSMVGVQFVNLASANFVPTNPDTSLPFISILSPIDNRTYTVKDVHLAFNVKIPSSWDKYHGRLTRVYYIMDAQESSNILGDMYDISENKYYYKTLTGLSDGTHSLIVCAEGHKDWRNEDSNRVFATSWDVYFTIDTTPPSILILSLENKTYDTIDIALNFTVTEPTSWIGYSLDAQANVTITGNTTLSELSYGSHNLTVYANDTAGNTGTSETIYFSMKTQQTGFLGTGLPIEYGYAIVTVIGVAIAAVAGNLFFKRLQQRKQPSTVLKGE